MKHRTFVVIAAVVGAFVLAGCAETETKTEPKPTAEASSNVVVPSGVTLTELGTRMSFGQTAVVAYEANRERGSVLEITVKGVKRASIAELGSYVLDEATRKATPYYVTMTVANVGQGDLGRIDVPIFLVDSTDTLVHSSSFTNTFKPCPSRALPASFAPSARVTTCQLYLVPEGATYKEMSFRPVQEVEPIVWEGDPTNTPERAKEVKRQAKKQKKAGN